MEKITCNDLFNKISEYDSINVDIVKKAYLYTYPLPLTLTSSTDTSNTETEYIPDS